MPSRRTNIINRNGQTQVITGWRAWLLGLGGLVFAWVVLAIAVFFLVRIATTIGIADLASDPELNSFTSLTSRWDRA